jgi:hypothetical protein
MSRETCPFFSDDALRLVHPVSEALISDGQEHCPAAKMISRGTVSPCYMAVLSDVNSGGLIGDEGLPGVELPYYKTA